MRYPFRALPVLLAISCAPFAFAADTAPVTPAFEVKPITPELAEKYTLDTAFYKKATMVQGILIATSGKVPDQVHLEAAYLFDHLMRDARDDVAQRIRDRGVLCIIIDHDERLSNLPQFGTDKTGEERDFYDWRNRGFLRMNQNGRPVVLFAEEDVMEYEGGMQLESILIHEFGHVIQGVGFDAELNAKLTEAFKNVKATGIWNDGYAAQRFRRVKSGTPVSLFDELVRAFPAQSPDVIRAAMNGGDILVNAKPCDAATKVTRDDKVLIVFGGPKECYHAKNRSEYFAEIYQTWYDTNRTMDHDHNHIQTREAMKNYDPIGSELLMQVLGDDPWRFVSPRRRAGEDHLAGYDPASAPKVEKLEHIDEAAQDYYDRYWEPYWKRLADKHAPAPAAP